MRPFLRIESILPTAALACVLLVVLALAACSGMGVSAGGGGISVAAENAGEEVVRGTVTYVQRIALPPDAIIRVNVADVSKADAPAEILGGVEFPADGKQVPLGFEIPVPKSRIQDKARIVVQARIEDAAGKLLFISTENIPVLTDGAPNEVEVRVDPVP